MVTLTLPRPKPGAVVHLAVEWSPTMPQRLTRTEFEQYRAGRNAALAEAAEQLGGRIAVLDV